MIRTIIYALLLSFLLAGCVFGKMIEPSPMYEIRLNYSEEFIENTYVDFLNKYPEHKVNTSVVTLREGASMLWKVYDSLNIYYPYILNTTRVKFLLVQSQDSSIFFLLLFIRQS